MKGGVGTASPWSSLVKHGPGMQASIISFGSMFRGVALLLADEIDTARMVGTVPNFPQPWPCPSHPRRRLTRRGLGRAAGSQVLGGAGGSQGRRGATPKHGVLYLAFDAHLLSCES